MRKELEDKLAEEFPFMRRQRSLEEQEKDGFIGDLYGAYGCDFEDGWYEVVRGLCLDIVDAHMKSGAPVNIVVDQVKEKFGSLRFYWHTAGNNPGIHAFDYSGIGGIRVKQDASEINQCVYEIVSKWEDISEKTCIRCGATGVFRRDLSWKLPLCDVHYADATKHDEAMKNPAYYRAHFEKAYLHLPADERQRVVDMLCGVKNEMNQEKGERKNDNTSI